MPTRNWREIGFLGRYKFYHSLGNAPGFINFGLRLFNHLRIYKRNRPKKAGLIFIFGPENILLFRKVVWQKAF